MIGKTGANAEFALVESSMLPPVSIRYPFGRRAMMGASAFSISMEASGGCMEIEKALAPIIARLPNGYRIETGGNIEDSTKANSALAPVFPIMVLLTLLVLVLQTRSLSAMTMVFLTAPLGLVGAVP